MLFEITTKNGKFLSTGKDEGEAKINFTIEFPSEKIRKIKPLEEKAILVSSGEMQVLKKFLKGRMKHAERRVSEIKAEQGDTPHETHNYFGGHTLGYWEGKLSTLNVIMDEIDEEEEGVVSE